jgi:hypothetical protein
MQRPPEIDPSSSSFHRAVKSAGFIALLLIGLTILQPNFSARLYDWLSFGEHSLLLGF